MIGLPANRYILVALKTMPARVLCYHPFYLKEIAPALHVINQFEPLFGLSDRNRLLASWELAPKNKEQSESESLRELCKFSLFSESLPATLNQEQFRLWFKDKKLGVTEIFDQSWNLPHIGSARSVLVGKVQIKGSGRTLNPFSLWFEANTGLLNAVEATISFVHSHLADTTLPLGSCAGIGVLIREDAYAPALYLREALYPRIAQMGPGLSEKIQHKIKESLSFFFRNPSPDKWVDNILGQYASMAYLGANFHSSPDNLLLNGQPIDEEDWLWPENFNQWSFVCEFLSSEKFSLQCDDLTTFPWEECSFRTGTFPAYRGIIKNFLKAFSFLSLSLPDADSLHSKFLELLSALSGDKRIISFWEEAERELSTYDPVRFRQWLKQLSSEGWTFRLQSLKEEGRFRLHLFRNRPKAPSALIQSFNQRIRPQVISLMHKMLPLLLSDSSIQNSDLPSKLCSFIARNAFCMPAIVAPDGSMKVNETTWDRYFDEFLNDAIIERECAYIVYWDGHEEKEVLLEKLKDIGPLRFIPISLKRIDSTGKTFEIPLKKRIIIVPGRKNEI